MHTANHRPQRLGTKQGESPAVLNAAIKALPLAFWRRLMVTCDGAGASHYLITQLDKLAARPGYQVIYSVGLDLGKRAAGTRRPGLREPSWPAAWEIARSPSTRNDQPREFEGGLS